MQENAGAGALAAGWALGTGCRKNRIGGGGWGGGNIYTGSLIFQMHNLGFLICFHLSDERSARSGVCK